MPRRSPGHPQSARSLLRVGAFLIIASVLASCLAAWELRTGAEADAWANANTIGELVAEQTRAAFQSVDLNLQDLQGTIASTGVADAGSASRMFESRQFHDTLLHQALNLPQVDSLLIVGADGKLLATSRVWPTPPVDNTDRDYFTYFKAHDGSDTFISAPTINRLSGHRSIFVARRLDGPGGVFLGVIAGSVRLNAFESLYAHIGLTDGAGVSLLRRDGLVLAQYPRHAGLVDRMPAKAPWYDKVTDGGGRYVSPGFLSNSGGHLVSVHPLKIFPVVVDSTMAEPVAFAHWRRQVTYIGLGALCAVLCILLLFRMLFAQFRRVELQASDLQRSSAALRESETRLQQKSDLLETTLDHMDQGLIMVDRDRRVAVYNQQAIEMLDLPPTLIAANPPFADIEAFKRHRDLAAGNVTGQLPDTADEMERPYSYERHCADGRDIEVRSVPVTGGGFVRTYTDITERKAAEARVRYLAHHDGLTRLANRTVLLDHLERELARDRRGESWAVLCLDLDQFKNVNDTLGHALGDQLLCVVAERLRGCVRDGDVVARLGGDEFAIVQGDVDQPAHASLLAERIIEAIGSPFGLDGHQVMIGTSIGIAIGPADGHDANTLLKHADLALYRAKTDGRGVYRFFEPTMDAQMQARRALEMDLRLALANGEFELFFQPVLNVRSSALSGFEALIRWRHPGRGLVPPVQFIPLAEEIGLIIPIGEWVLREACRQAMLWPGALKVAVNLSPVQFRSNNLVNAARTALEASGLPPSRLELEITESVLLLNSEATLDMLHRLHELGLSISMDDFGTGYSSLSYLRSFPFDKIKIDQSFIRDLDGTRDSLAIVHAIMDLSRTLGMSVTAEGVETSEQFAILRAEGCTDVQGYLFSAPQPAPDVPAIISRLGAGALQAA